MTLYAAGKVLKVYRVSLGSDASGNAKQKQGDHETPEGNYTINGRNEHSCCHLALHISYPNATDRQRARKLGVDQLDLLILHQALPSDFDRTLEAYRALETLLVDGKVRAIGASTFPADLIVISTHPIARSRWLKKDLVENTRKKFERPVVHVVSHVPERATA